MQTLTKKENLNHYNCKRRRMTTSQSKEVNRRVVRKKRKEKGE